MSRKCTKQEKKIEFAEKDFVIIRPMSHDEMRGARSNIADNSMMSEFLTEMSKLLDRDPNGEVKQKLESSIAEIKKLDENKLKSIEDYNNAILKNSIVKIVDDGVEQKIEEYLVAIDFKTYEKILIEIYELNMPSKKEKDFLE